MRKAERIVIVGGGTAGISVAARLRKSLFGTEIVIVDHAQKHYYQPLWTLVGAGVFPVSESVRNEETCIPDGVKWIRERVLQLHPNENTIESESGQRLEYSILVVCPGLQINWSRIKGLEQALSDRSSGVCSNYSYDHVEKTWENIRSFKGGTAIFTQPNTPIKCGGAPQKIAYLAEDYFQQQGIRNKCKVIFASGQPHIFAVQKYATALEKVIERKKIKTHFKFNLTEINGEKKEATFENLEDKSSTTLSYDMIHVTPPMGPPDFIKESPLADSAGWVDVDKQTLQHSRYKNVFSLGDAANLPTSKTGAAIRKQAPVVVANILSVLGETPPVSHYDGYTSCPLVTGYKSMILAEFDYALQPQETFPFDQSQERYSMYLLKNYVLPVFYWDGMLKGRL
ncbi:MAG: FAD/NAD(P)-binding oxidoreductase [Candidatus Obscuribacterales bacterium]